MGDATTDQELDEHAAEVAECAFLVNARTTGATLLESMRLAVRAAHAVYRAPLDAEIARLTVEVATMNATIDRANAETGRRLDEAHETVDHAKAEVATLRAKLDEAEARWRAAELFATPTCGAFDGMMHCDAAAEWSPADRDHRCTEHTTREGAEETKR